MERTVKVVLEAIVSGFTAKMAAAAGSVKAFDARVQKSVKDHGQAWGTMSTGLLAVGAAITGVGVAAMKTGIDYNALQQKSRAALKTILGSAEAANAQMDKLDVFARTSPFAKQVFITAQQQMLAFGVATEQVIPYLSALDNAVAAAGGSNDDIAELAFIMAKVTAAGKITSRELIQFGQHGIDAAGLIAEAMGKTGPEIRQAITSNALSGQEAMDALAKGMSTKFAGASANVKTTWDGAMDRVKGAWRDLGSLLAEPLVGKSGGGFAVDLANQLATVTRAFIALPAPVQTAVTVIAGAAGALTLAGGTAMKIIPKIQGLFKAMDTLTNDFPKLGRAAKIGGIALGAVGAAMGVAAIAFGIWANKQAEAQARTAAFSETLKVQNGVASETADTWSSVTKTLTETKTGFMGLGPSYADVAQAAGLSVADVTRAIQGQAGALDNLKAKLSAYEQANLNNYGVSTVAGDTRALLGLVGDMTAQLAESKKQTEQKAEADRQMAQQAHGAAAGFAALRGDVRAEGDAADTAADANSGLADATGEVADKAQDAQNQIKTLMDALFGMANASMDVDAANVAVERAIDKATKAAKENGKTLDATKAKGQDNRDALRDLASAAQTATQKIIEKGVADGDVAQASIDATDKMQRYRDQFIKVAKAMTGSKEKAKTLADQYGLIPANVNTQVVAQGMDGVTDDMVKLAQAAKSLPSAAKVTILAEGARPAKAEVDNYMKSVTGLPKDVTSAIRTVAELGGVQAADKAIAGLNKNPKIRLSETGSATVKAAVNRVSGALKALNGDSATVYIKVKGGKYATGGPIFGPGTSTSDSVPAMLSTGEHVLTASDVRKLGGQGAVYRMRSLAQAGRLHFAAGGDVPERRYTVPGLSITPAQIARVDDRPNVSVVVHNTYPVSQPADVTINHGLQLAAAIGRG